MTALINVSIAVILTLRGINCLTRRSPYFSKPEHFLVFLLATGMFRTGGIFIAGFNLSSLRLMIWIILISYTLLAFKNTFNQSKSLPFNLPIVTYSLFLGWCLLNLVFYSSSLTYGFRVFLKLLYPFLVLLLARRFVITPNVPVYLHITFVATLLVSIFTSGISEKIPYLVYNPIITDVFWPRATFADHAAIMVGVGLALWSANLAGTPLFHGSMMSTLPKTQRKKLKRFFKNWQYTLGIIWLCASPLAVTSRTGLLATSGSISTFLLYRYRFKAIPFIVLIIFLGLWIVIYMPSFSESTFYGKNVTIYDVQRLESSDINSSGRFEMWDYLLKRFYNPSPLVGSGLGTTQKFMYEAAISGRGPFGNLRVPHSEYVTLLCDVGLIGLVLYLLTGVCGLILGLQAVFAYKKSTRILGLAVAASFVALFLIMGFDNAFQYALAVHQYPYAFLGMLIAADSQPDTPPKLS